MDEECKGDGEGAIEMNFTGYKKPTDEEFKRCYKELFEASPRPKDYDTKQYKAKVEESRRRFLEAQEINLKIELLPGEKWLNHPTLKTYQVSNLGRIKIRGKIQRQVDNPNGKLGYLVLEKYPKVLVYRLVADVFLERKTGEYRAVHHIDNDGYNCGEDNLIMLTKAQHDAIHTNEMEEW